MLLAKHLQNGPPGVMSRPYIFFAWIAKANNDIHLSILNLVENKKKYYNSKPIAEFMENPLQTKPKKENVIIETIKFILLALIIVFPIRLFIAQPFVVSGASMDPSFRDGQYLIVD